MSETTPDEIKILAKAPMIVAHKYSSYTINGFSFHTEYYKCGNYLTAWFKFTTPRGNVLYPSIIACHLIS